jgi:hypothetical protein
VTQFLGATNLTAAKIHHQFVMFMGQVAEGKIDMGFDFGVYLPKAPRP